MNDIDKNGHILVVEDEEADFLKIERSLKKARIANPLIHIEHGDEALQYLTRSGKYLDNPDWIEPSIVLLDINLPGTDGVQILEAAKHTELIKRIPIIVLTTSSDELDINRCYDHGANSYVTKPFSSKGFFEAMEKIRDYWFTLNVQASTKI